MNRFTIKLDTTHGIRWSDHVPGVTDRCQDDEGPSVEWCEECGYDVEDCECEDKEPSR